MTVNCHSPKDSLLSPNSHNQIHLLTAALQVQSEEPFGSSQHLQNVINQGQWESLS
jgi:hypothetical protein